LSGQTNDPALTTVLIVDDEPLVALMMSQAFQDAGYNPLVAHNALSALELLEVSGQRIVLMVTDVRMPGAMDGLELGHVAVQRYPDLAVLTMTGYTLEDGRSAVGTVLQKPFNIDQLLQVARRIVEDGRYWREMMKPR
jgi:DNA-binding NtrC family response regulator